MNKYPGSEEGSWSESRVHDEMCCFRNRCPSMFYFVRFKRRDLRAAVQFSFLLANFARQVHLATRSSTGSENRTDMNKVNACLCVTRRITP